VPESGGGLGLALEPFHHLVAGPLAEQEHLDRDDPVELHLPRLVDDPHPAVRQLLEQLVIPKA